jgi:hypothetical protein
VLMLHCADYQHCVTVGWGLQALHYVEHGRQLPVRCTLQQHPLMPALCAVLQSVGSCVTDAGGVLLRRCVLMFPGCGFAIPAGRCCMAACMHLACSISCSCVLASVGTCHLSVQAWHCMRAISEGPVVVDPLRRLMMAGQGFAGSLARCPQPPPCTTRCECQLLQQAAQVGRGWCNGPGCVHLLGHGEVPQCASGGVCSCGGCVGVRARSGCCTTTLFALCNVMLAYLRLVDPGGWWAQAGCERVGVIGEAVAAASLPPTVSLLSSWSLEGG